jgi:DNA-binding YbaB/EbfC family protein
LQQLMQQAAEMQSQVAQSRAALAGRSFTGSAGGGMVIVAAGGNGELESVRIDASVLDPSDPDLVGDLVLAAANQALRKVQEAAAESLGSIGGLDLGGLLG